jgi:UbiD family decarboxylase
MRDFMAALDARGDLLHVYREVDPKHELAAVTHAATTKYRKPVLFHKVKGTRFPRASPASTATRERIAAVLGIRAEGLLREWSKARQRAQVTGTTRRCFPARLHRPTSDYFDCELLRPCRCIHVLGKRDGARRTSPPPMLF